MIKIKPNEILLIEVGENNSVYLIKNGEKYKLFQIKNQKGKKVMRQISEEWILPKDICLMMLKQIDSIGLFVLDISTTIVCKGKLFKFEIIDGYLSIGIEDKRLGVDIVDLWEYNMQTQQFIVDYHPIHEDLVLYISYMKDLLKTYNYVDGLWVLDPLSPSFLWYNKI